MNVWGIKYTDDKEPYQSNAREDGGLPKMAKQLDIK
jgi:hypothetical protein